MIDLFRDTPLPVLILLLIVVLLLATQAGRLVARRADGEDKEASGLATGMLGIFALLIAFTYSLSLARYDARRGEVLQEANAIGTTANYALMLPPQYRRAVLPMLRAYTLRRIALVAPHDEAAFRRDNAASNAILTRLWAASIAMSACRSSPSRSRC